MTSMWRCSVDENPYSNLYVDLTDRCNMDCNFCYNPQRADSDLDIDYFSEVCARLPSPVNMRFLGGEPTLNRRFFDFIDVALRHRHTVFFASNGIKYNDPRFLERLERWSGRITAGLSMDGGTRDNEFYLLLNNRASLDQKMTALENLHRRGIARVCLSAIIMRGENERVIGELYELAQRYQDVVRYIHFRSASMVGKWVSTLPYSLDELKDLARPHFGEAQFLPKCVNEINCNRGDGDCCYRFRPTPRLQVSLIEFATERSAQCPKRGKLARDSFEIEPFFANMISTGEFMAQRFGEVEVRSAV